jgi:hypothetical protein
MSVRRHTLHDGITLQTASGCRYVTFYVGNHAAIYKRSHNVDTARKNHRTAVDRGFSRVVTVDFRDGHTLLDTPARKRVSV